MVSAVGQRSKLQRLLAAGSAAALIGGAAAVLPSTAAQATTGNADGLPEPKILVNPSIGDFYIGRFYLSRVEKRAGLESAVLDVDYTESVEHEFIVGDGQFYQYNKQGTLTSWTASLYPYVYSHGLMSCNLLVPGTTNQVLGKLVLNKPTDLDTASHPNQETITGKLTLGHSTYAVTLKQSEDDNPAPKVLPKATQTANLAKAASVSGASPATTSLTGVYASVARFSQALGNADA